MKRKVNAPKRPKDLKAWCPLSFSSEILLTIMGLQDKNTKNSIKPKNYIIPLPSLLVPAPFTKGGCQADPPPPSYLKNRCPHEREMLQGIRDTFESLRNVDVVTIATPQRRGIWGKIARSQPKVPIIQIATRFTIFKITL